MRWFAVKLMLLVEVLINLYMPILFCDFVKNVLTSLYFTAPLAETRLDKKSNRSEIKNSVRRLLLKMSNFAPNHFIRWMLDRTHILTWCFNFYIFCLDKKWILLFQKPCVWIEIKSLPVWTLSPGCSSDIVTVFPFKRMSLAVAGKQPPQFLLQ